MYELIKELTEMSGPIGQEHAVVDRMEALWQAGGARTERTGINNLLAHVGGQGPRLLLAAHADELSYLVRAIDPAGFLWLANGQGWTRTTSMRNAFTIGQRVRVLADSGELPGIIATTTGHLASLALPEPGELDWDDFWVDTGLSRDELLASGVRPGTRVIWEAATTRFGPHIVGKALDDRVLLAVLTELQSRLDVGRLQYELVLACTVQEEIGLVGAEALAHRHHFDYAIALEIGMAGDIPGVAEKAMPLTLGQGPVLVHKDARVHYDYLLGQKLIAAAAAADIPLQHAVFGSFGSDGAAFQRRDIPSALIAFPCRYTHTPFETGHMRDIEQMVDWLEAFVYQAP